MPGTRSDSLAGTYHWSCPARSRIMQRPFLYSVDFPLHFCISSLEHSAGGAVLSGSPLALREHTQRLQADIPALHPCDSCSSRQPSRSSASAIHDPRPTTHDPRSTNPSSLRSSSAAFQNDPVASIFAHFLVTTDRSWHCSPFDPHLGRPSQRVLPDLDSVWPRPSHLTPHTRTRKHSVALQCRLSPK